MEEKLGKIPNLFLVGAMKSFTTSLAASFRCHPETFIPSLKEPHFFTTDLFQDTDPIVRWTHHGFSNINRIRCENDYISLYNNAPDGAIYVIDASTSYLYSKDAARNIHRFNSEAKIIILLRDPVMRAWSEYKMNHAMGLETDTFRNAVDRELKSLSRRRFNPYKRYIKAGLYGEQVERYKSIFPNSNIHICIVDQPGKQVKSINNTIARFLELSPSIPLQEFRMNMALSPPNTYLNSVLYFTGLRALIRNSTPVKMRDSLKQLYYRIDTSLPELSDIKYLASIFENSNRHLQEITRLDISHWSQ